MNFGKFHIVSGKKLDQLWHELAIDLGIIFWDEPWIQINYRKVEEFESELTENHSPWIFTSGNALEAIQPLVGKIKTSEAYVIAEKTKFLAEKLGFEILGFAENSSELGKLIIKENIHSVCHPTTPSHRKELPEILQHHGILYHPIWVYDQIPTSINYPNFQGVLFFSPNQVDTFFQIHRMDSNIPAFCIGPTTASQLNKFNHNKTIIAQRTTIESMMEELLNYFDTHES